MLQIIGLLTTIVSLACTIYVGIAMIKEKGLGHGLFAIICCQIYAYIWGWSGWVNERKMPIMIIWTIAILISIAMNVTVAMSASGGSLTTAP